MTTPDVWGPHAWKFLHYVTLNYPNHPTDNDKQRYKDFFSLMQYVLPCSICSKHFSENLKILPLSPTVLESRDNLIKWCIDIHNIVNKSKNKPVISYDDAYKNMNTNTICVEKFETKNTLLHSDNTENFTDNNENNILCYLLPILCILIIIAIVYKKR